MSFTASLCEQWSAADNVVSGRAGVLEDPVAGSRAFDTAALFFASLFA